jgi:hypothetical protein
MDQRKAQGIKMKQAYKKTALDFDWGYDLIELTGRCKKVTGGPYEEAQYYQVQRRLFGIPLGKYWLHEANVKFYDPIVEIEYDCKCGEEK